MFTNRQNAEVKLQIVGERGLKIVAQTLARTRYKLRQYLELAWGSGCVGELQFGGVAVCGICDVGEFWCGRVSLCGSCVLGET